MTRRLVLLVCALSLALSLSGCWEEDVADEEDFWLDESLVSSGADESAPSLTPITAFTLPYLSAVTLDPITCPDGVQQTLSSLLYEPLFVLDASFAPQNVLCRDYEVNDSHTRFTFYLRENVRFSDGSALTASDVLATLRRAAQSERYGARFASVSSMRVSGGALVVTLTRASSAFPALLDIPIVKSGSEKSSVPVGTGPYLFVTDGDGAFLKRSGEWWRDDVLPLERIELREVKDADTASYLFSSREVHLLSADLTAGRDLPSVETDITDFATANLLYLSFNTGKSLLADEALRAALSASIDRETVASGYLAGHAEAASFPLSPCSPLYPASLAKSLASPDLAAALSAAGITDARPRTLTLLVNEGDAFKCSIAEYLAETLSLGALTVTVKALPWADYLDSLSRGTWDLALCEVRLTADWDVSSLVRAGGALNFGGFSDAQCDALLDAFLADSSAETAAAFCRRLAESAPIAPIAFKRASLLTPTGLIDGLSPTASVPFFDFAHWRFSFDG